MGLPCAAISVITDECDPDNLQPVNIGEIIEILGRAGSKLGDVFTDVVINFR
jgi:purine-nucleoside phosphorylase